MTSDVVLIMYMLMFSGTSDASTYKAFASSPSWYRKGDNQIVSGVLSSQSQTEPSDSATTTTPLRGN